MPHSSPGPRTRSNCCDGRQRPDEELAAGPLGRYECEETGVILAAGWAAVEVCLHSGNRCVRIGAGQLELDIAVEILEAGFTRQLWPRRAQQISNDLVVTGSGCHWDSPLSGRVDRSSLSR